MLDAFEPADVGPLVAELPGDALARGGEEVDQLVLILLHQTLALKCEN